MGNSEEIFPRERIPEFHKTQNELRLFQKKSIFGRCLHGNGACVESPINSHLLAETWLRKISDNTGHLVQLGPETKIINGRIPKIEARRQGIHQTNTFPGFCRKHDAEIFQCLEQEEFVGNEMQLLTLTYRSVCREFCIKQQMVAGHFPKFLNHLGPHPLENHIINEMKRCIRLHEKLLALEQMIASGENGVAAYVVEFSETPSLLVSATFIPMFTFAGKQLERRHEWMTVSIIPNIKGLGGWAVFTWDKAKPTNSSLIAKSFEKVDSIYKTTALLNFAIEVSENHAISPEWWASLGQYKKDTLMRWYSRNLAPDYGASTTHQLMRKVKLISDWKPNKSYFIG